MGESRQGGRKARGRGWGGRGRGRGKSRGEAGVRQGGRAVAVPRRAMRNFCLPLVLQGREGIKVSLLTFDLGEY